MSLAISPALGIIRPIIGRCHPAARPTRLRFAAWLSPARFERVVLTACLLFLALQVIYVVRLPLVMDEFQHAASTHRLAESTPYRDFYPYKTLLGYYLQLPVLLTATRPWEALIAVKIEMALLVATSVAWAALVLGRIFDRRAVAIGLGMLLVMSTFAERSAELRVDMLTSLAGLGSLVLLLRGRAVWAGVVVALSFLISQKGIYYILAGNAALGAVWLFVDRSRRQLISCLAFNAALGAVLLGYLGLWSLVASANDVVQATFFSHGDIAFRQLYDNRLKYWSQTLRRNPLFYLLATLGLLRLLQSRPGGLAPRVRIGLAAYGGTLIALSLLHRQPWPYFFVLLAPTLWILAIAFLQAGMEGWRGRPPTYKRALVALLIGFGFLWPLTRVPVVVGRSNGYQRSTIELADRLLEDGSSYLAGTELIFDRRQRERRLAWLDIPTNRALSKRPIYELEAIRRDLAAEPPKFVVNNYRIYGLPRNLRRHLARTYEPWWGSVAIYSPAVEAGEQSLRIAFAGLYEIVATTPAVVRIGERTWRPGDQIELAAGELTMVSDRSFRLRYVPPDVESYLDPQFRQSRLLFPEVYTY